MHYNIIQKQKSVHTADFEILDNNNLVGSISAKHIRTTIVTGDIQLNDWKAHFKTKNTSKDNATGRLLFYENDNLISDLRQLSRYNPEYPLIREPYIHIGYELISYQAFLISMADQGSYVVIQRETGEQIAEIDRPCVVKNELFNYELFATSDLAAKLGLLMAAYRFVIFDFSYGTIPWTGLKRLPDPQTVNQRILARYDPAFRERC